MNTQKKIYKKKKKIFLKIIAKGSEGEKKKKRGCLHYFITIINHWRFPDLSLNSLEKDSKWIDGVSKPQLLVANALNMTSQSKAWNFRPGMEAPGRTNYWSC